MSKKNVDGLRGVVFCCHGGSCARAGAREVEKALRAGAREQGLKPEIKFVRTACAGLCKQAPVVIVCANTQQAGNGSPSTYGARWLLEVEAERAPALLAQHLGTRASGQGAPGTQAAEKPPKQKKAKKAEKAEKAEKAKR